MFNQGFKKIEALLIEKKALELEIVDIKDSLVSAKLKELGFKIGDRIVGTNGEEGFLKTFIAVAGNNWKGEFEYGFSASFYGVKKDGTPKMTKDYGLHCVSVESLKLYEA